jgi:hypothetical protein
MAGKNLASRIGTGLLVLGGAVQAAALSGCTNADYSEYQQPGRVVVVQREVESDSPPLFICKSADNVLDASGRRTLIYPRSFSRITSSFEAGERFVAVAYWEGCAGRTCEMIVTPLELLSTEGPIRIPAGTAKPTRSGQLAIPHNGGIFQTCGFTFMIPGRYELKRTLDGRQDGRGYEFEITPAR